MTWSEHDAVRGSGGELATERHAVPPEKSSHAGIALLRNWLATPPRTGRLDPPPSPTPQRSTPHDRIGPRPRCRRLLRRRRHTVAEQRKPVWSIRAARPWPPPR
ncbi:hypothetical protein QJS66_06415 [Kocuria rhizophila]|nr:hypothetical protein QJS66_06415 [Kocuria rhizophila]